MGEVWKARDSRLGRDVAIKVLPAEFASDAELRERFEREARAIANLSHPHICTLYDVGDGYLVMELLDGEPLDQRLERGPMPIEDVLRYGAQIAEALDRAHRAGIVHRDLKPGNVMLTKSGVKLLDFGLAKSARIPTDDDDLTRPKTLTQTGIVVGTLAYMAPEQREGKDVDARTDIFALGATLYEMATAKLAFDGRRISELRPEIPAALDHLITKCLSRDPEERWQNARDLAGQLQWIAASPRAVPAETRGRTRERVAWIALLLTLAVAVAAWLAMRPRPREEIVEAAIPTEGDPEENSGPMLSPDGKQLAYASADTSGRRTVRIRSIEDGTTRSLSGTDYAYAPFWSPDGRFLAFFVSNVLKKVAVAGGESETVARGACCAGTWSRDGVILHSDEDLIAIHRVSASGGESSVTLKASAVGAERCFWPSFLPDGKHFLFLAFGGDAEKRAQDGIWLATLDGREKPRFMTRADTNAVYVEPGYLLFARDGVLRAQSFDPRTLRVTGEPRTIAPIQRHPRFAAFTVSNSGLLVYQPPSDAPPFEVVLKNRKGEVLRTIGPAAEYRALRVSPDGQHVAVARANEKGRADIWVTSIVDGTSNRFTFDERSELWPAWSPDGELAYSMVFPGNVWRLIRKRANEPPQTIVALPGAALTPHDWSPDGRHLAADRLASGNVDVVVWSFAKRMWMQVAATPALESTTSFSPDGKWLTYLSDESGRNEVYVQPFPPTGEKHQISSSGAHAPRWSRGGEIFWVDPSNHLTVTAVATTPAFRIGASETLFPIDQPGFVIPRYDAMPDGNVLVIAPVRAQSKPMTLVVNWRKRVE